MINVTNNMSQCYTDISVGKKKTNKQIKLTIQMSPDMKLIIVAKTKN